MAEMPVLPAFVQPVLAYLASTIDHTPAEQLRTVHLLHELGFTADLRLADARLGARYMTLQWLEGKVSALADPPFTNSLRQLAYINQLKEGIDKHVLGIAVAGPGCAVGA